MSPEENKDLVRRYWEILNQGNLDILDEVYTVDFVWHLPDQDIRGLEESKQVTSMYLSAFPDMRFIAEEVIAEGDKVVTRVKFRGTHRGELMLIAPTERQIELKIIFIHRIEGGKIVEMWEMYDNLSFMRELGVFPPRPEVLARTVIHQAEKLRSRLRSKR